MDGSLSLPFEMVEEILYKTRTEDLIRAKSVCKQWYGLCKDKRFIYKHLDLSHDVRFFQIYRDKVQIIHPVTLDLLCLPVPTEFFSGNENIYSVIHCNGLLLCAWDNCKLAVWNPVLSSRVKWIEPLHVHKFFYTNGFGYDSDNNYKILRFDSYCCKEYEIYDFMSKRWRVLPYTFDWVILPQLQYVSMKGNMYWIAKTMNGNIKSEMFIQSFDFSKETFKTVCSSLPVVVGVDIIRPKLLSWFGGDRLSLLHQHHFGDDSTREIKIEVWVTNKVTDGVVSWTKYLNVTRPDLPILHPNRYRFNPTYFIHKTNGIMLWCDKVVKENNNVQEDNFACAKFYEIGEGEIIRQFETGPRYAGNRRTCMCGDLYVPSLVPVPE